MIDELIDAFGADAFHVGMDEVFLVAHPSCPRCKGKDPAELFAKSVNDLHGHIVDERKLTMLMWADRLLDDKKFGYGKWEASHNGTGPAIDRIPKDIIMCDWHYETRPKGYPRSSISRKRAFAMLPSTWWNKDAALAMLREARIHGHSQDAGPPLHDLGWNPRAFAAHCLASCHRKTPSPSPTPRPRASASGARGHRRGTQGVHGRTEAALKHRRNKAGA